MRGRCGTTGGYQAHRDADTPTCAPCRKAQADWMRHYRTRLYLAGGALTIDAVGTRRRLQALARMGWSFVRMGEELGVTGGAVQQWTRTPLVRRSTAQRVIDLYDRWWDKPGPSVKTRARAVAAGWPPPLAWDDEMIDDPDARSNRGYQRRSVAFDEVAVQRAMGGDRVHLRPAERAEAVRRLTAGTASVAHIADRLGVSPRSVSRLRSPQEAS